MIHLFTQYALQNYSPKGCSAGSPPCRPGFCWFAFHFGRSCSFSRLSRLRQNKKPARGLFCCMMPAHTKKEPKPALFSDITARPGRLRNASDCIVRGTNLWPRRVFVCVYSILSSCPLVKLRPLFFCQRRQPPPSASACKRVCAVNSHTSRQSNVLNTEVPVTIKQSFFTSKAGRRGVRRPAVSAGSFCQAP